MKLISLSFDSPGGTVQIVPPTGVPTGGLSDGGPFSKILGNGILLIFVAASLLALFFFIWGGLQWIMSGGDKTKVQAARSRMTYAIIGLIICFLGFAIVALIGDLFGVKLL